MGRRFPDLEWDSNLIRLNIFAIIEKVLVGDERLFANLVRFATNGPKKLRGRLSVLRVFK